MYDGKVLVTLVYPIKSTYIRFVLNEERRVTMTINGVQKAYPEGISLTEVLKQEGYETERIAVERNEEIVPKTEYHKVFLKDADHLEVVRFVGGG